MSETWQLAHWALEGAQIAWLGLLTFALINEWRDG